MGLKKEAAAAKEAVRAAATEQAEWEREREAAQEEIRHWKQQAAAAEQARECFCMYHQETQTCLALVLSTACLGISAGQHDH